MNKVHQKSKPSGEMLAGLSIENLRTDVIGPLSLKVEPSECVVLTGPSGSGKSLILRAISDLDPSTGTVKLGDNLRESVAGKDWRRIVGLLPAEPAWWADTVGEHFTSGEDGIIESLGFDSGVMGWQVEHASSGERQRLALARLLRLEPRVLLLDEPTANLDETNRARVEAVVCNYLARSGSAVLWVTHDVEQSKRVGNRRLQIEAGLIKSEVCT